MIDLRSDTVTQPTEAMRAAMAAAPVGDDVYREDPTILRLEARTAELLGCEDAVFVPSGTMSNQIAFQTHTEPGDMAIMDAKAHMVINEGGGGAALSGVTVGRIPHRDGVFAPDDVDELVGVDHPFNPPHHGPLPRLVCVENTHNEGGGVVWPLQRLRAVAERAREHGLAVHMDGARIWHASAASEVDVGTLAEPFDTVSVCFSKGLGAPVGSALAGSGPLIDRARRFKQMYGGGFRQAGILAAGALHALDHHRDRLVEDLARARRLAEGIEALDGLSVDLERVQSNIVRFQVDAMTAARFVEGCHERGVRLLPGGARGVRAVLHLGIADEDVDAALGTFGDVLAGDDG